MSAESSEILNWGKKVLLGEAECLANSSERLGSDFYNAVNAVIECKGRVVVTGLGKSGHVARKLAATFASTGTASFFVHGAEALHGDLGMITPSDLLVAIAYSGETAEIVSVAQYARRRSIPIISITGATKSTLAKLSSFVLDGFVESEVDSLGLAPTSSSTVALALGDALAVSAMRAKGFSESDFASVHPGGKLGKRLSSASDFQKVIEPEMCLTGSDDFHKTLEAVTAKNFGIAIVLRSDGTLDGVVTDGDVRRILSLKGPDALATQVKEFMTTNPKVISEDFLAVDAVDFMNTHSITNVLVVNENHEPTGLVRMHDLLSEKVV